MVITPPQLQFNLQLWCNEGILPILTEWLPGAHGAIVAGTQGIGVKIPNAEALAAATVGFAKEEHIPKGRIFTKGLLSMILAAGILLVITLFCGKTTREEGPVPKEHFIMAPIQTCCGISIDFILDNYLN